MPAGPDEQDALLRLSLVSGLGPHRVKTLVDAFGTGVSALGRSADELSPIPGIGASCVTGIVQARRIDTRGIWKRAERIGAAAIVLSDERYPVSLKEIFDPPPVLWVRGTPPHPAARLVAVVGTRRATGYGREMARHVAAELVRAGIGVVSGLALGIDGEAHRGALSEDGYTIGVLGSGVDRVYPPSHRHLAADMVARGCVLSEFLPGTPSVAGHFPRRNRIISGLCKGCAVIEAHERGGALITARLALDQGRDVFALPGPVGSAASRGTHSLVRDTAARLIVDVAGMITEMWPDASLAERALPPVTPLESRLLAAIPPVAATFDHVCRTSGVEVSTALATLLDLEFRGLVRQLAGRQFLRTALADSVQAWDGPTAFVS